jgi:hypothetical protein
MMNPEWRALPELLRRKDVLRVTGWSKRRFYVEVSTHTELVARVPGLTEMRVRKATLIQVIANSQ